MLDQSPPVVVPLERACARARGLTYYSDSYIGVRVCRRALQGLKVGHKYTLAGTMCSSRQKVSTLHETKIRLKHTPRKAHGPFGFMINVCVVICDVVTIIIRTLVPIESKLVVRFPAAQPVKAQVPRLWFYLDQCAVGHSYCGVVFRLNRGRRMLPPHSSQSVSYRVFGDD